MMKSSDGILGLRKGLIRLKYSLSERNIVIALSVTIGITAGFAAIGLKTGVHTVERILRSALGADLSFIAFFLLPAAGIGLTLLFTRLIIRDDISHGVSKVIYAIAKKRSRFKTHNIFSSLVACTLTVGFGGSVGMEAPILLTGAAIGSKSAELFRIGRKTRTILLCCGTAAVVSAIFKAPITGLIFALEVLMVGTSINMIIPILISAVTADLVSILASSSQIEFQFAVYEAFKVINAPFYILLGILTGLASLYMMKVSQAAEQSLGKIRSPWKRLLAGGAAVGILVGFFPPLFGEGYSAMRAMLGGNPEGLLEGFKLAAGKSELGFMLFLVALLIFKPIAMAATTASGGIGGVFAPSLFMGGVMGLLFSLAVNMTGVIELSMRNFTLVGMAGLISGVMHAPLTAIFLIAEITGGYVLFIPLIITSIFSFMTVKPFEAHSIYTKHLFESGVLLPRHKDKAASASLALRDIVEKDHLTVSEDETLGSLVSKIERSTRNLFPVVDGEGRLAGIVSLDDVRSIMFDRESYETVRMHDIMSKPRVTAGISDPVEQVLDNFKRSGVWNIPVTEGELYIGFVSRSRLLSEYRKKVVDLSED